MDTAQLKKAGLAILALGLLAVGLHFGYSQDPIHLYIGIGASVLGLVLAGVGFVKK